MRASRVTFGARTVGCRRLGRLVWTWPKALKTQAGMTTRHSRWIFFRKAPNHMGMQSVNPSGPIRQWLLSGRGFPNAPGGTGTGGGCFAEGVAQVAAHGGQEEFQALHRLAFFGGEIPAFGRIGLQVVEGE